jgi:hypothetical protein
MKLEFSVYRYNPDVDDAPRMQDYTLEAEEGRDMMLLDALIQLKEKDPSLSFRRSCREGVCGSDGLNMNGKNGLACITPISALNQPGQKIVIRPLPGLPVIRDLVVDMGQFYAQYEKIKPYLLNNGQNPPAREHLQCLSSVKTRWSVRVYSLRMLFNVLPVVLVEPGQVYRPGRSAGCVSLPDRQPRYRNRQPSGRTERCFQRIPLSQHHELRQCVSEGAEPDARHRPY